MSEIDAIRADAEADHPTTDRRVLLAEIDHLNGRLAAIKVRVVALQVIVASLIDGESLPEIRQADEGPGAGGGHWT